MGDNIVDFLEKLKAVIDAKIAHATPAVKAILGKVTAAVQDLIAKAKAGVESGKGLLVDLLDKIIAKIGELKDNITGYSILTIFLMMFSNQPSSMPLRTSFQPLHSTLKILPT